MKIIHAIIPIYVDNIGNAVEIYFNDITTTKYYSLDCCIKKNCKKWTAWSHRNKKNNQKNIEYSEKSSYLFEKRNILHDQSKKNNIKKWRKLWNIQHRFHTRNTIRRDYTYQFQDHYNLGIQEKYRRQNPKSKTVTPVNWWLHLKIGHLKIGFDIKSDFVGFVAWFYILLISKRHKINSFVYLLGYIKYLFFSPHHFIYNIGIWLNNSDYFWRDINIRIIPNNIST